MEVKNWTYEEFPAEYSQRLRKCRLFTGVPEEYYPEVLDCLHCSVGSLYKNERLLSSGDPFRFAYFLLPGDYTGREADDAVNGLVSKVDGELTGKFSGSSQEIIQGGRSAIFYICNVAQVIYR